MYCIDKLSKNKYLIKEKRKNQPTPVTSLDKAKKQKQNVLLFCVSFSLRNELLTKERIVNVRERNPIS